MVHVPLMFVSEWREFPSAPCLAGKKLDSSRLDAVEIARVAWHASFQPLWQEKTCNSAHEQTPLSNDTIDSVLRHGEVGRAKDLSASPRNTGRPFYGVPDDGNSHGMSHTMQAFSAVKMSRSETRQKGHKYKKCVRTWSAVTHRKLS